ncbi:MAG TPA: glycosyl transferase [Vicinamibacteria bacterium]|nr:glycosyl transferase [Vicinamibacteria bacterium]
MSDFYQTGLIATLHRLGEARLEPLERELEQFSAQAPLALVLPALHQDFVGPAMEGILQELKQVHYVDQFVLALSRTTREQFREARDRLRSVPGDVRIVWIDGPRITRLFQSLEEQGLFIGPDGKGRSCWMAYGYVLAVRRARVIALHDCDIVNYQRYMLARLCYPVMNPNLPFEFCKGYYARLSDRMHGRVMRLLLTPLVRSMSELCGSIRFLRYIDSFRYALAGEFAMHADLARVNRIPSDWGLEVGVLAEIYRNCSLKRICQVDIADNYEHKHQDLSSGNPATGLMKMAVDISKAMFRILAAEGVKFDGGTMRTLRINYVRTAEDTIARYGADAMINGLHFDRHEEETAVETFSQALKLAAEEFFADPLGAPPLPTWNRVSAALPAFLDTLKETVEADNAE